MIYNECIIPIYCDRNGDGYLEIENFTEEGFLGNEKVQTWQIFHRKSILFWLVFLNAICLDRYGFLV